MYAKMYGYNTGYQTFAMLSDLKLGAVLHFDDLTRDLTIAFEGQYAKVPPRATFVAQVSGTILGSSK